MKKLEIYLIRIFLIAVLAVMAVSPFLAASHLVHGLATRTIDITHVLSLGYLLLIALALFLISPAFTHHGPRDRRQVRRSMPGDGNAV
ncbi:hypothetical protein [Rhizobium sp. C4]|uniref:hypothetical protein n=1 Tax=Rhizobium sp. C4 TaxID=1349800 RepID=UPI001E48A3CD|nr:hypothetical protein [Rhizobium sp. C4]MCD2174293.1 hypothetical protein [Rhizobium sp. C4]